MNKEAVRNTLDRAGLKLKKMREEVKDFTDSTHFNGGIPIWDILQTAGEVAKWVGAAGVAGFAALKSIKVVPPQHEAVRVILGKRVGEQGEGPMISIPFIERDIYVDKRPVLVGTPEAISTYARDGSEIQIDVGVVLVPGRGRDVVGVAPLAPIVRIGEAPNIVNIAGTTADTATRDVIPAVLRTAKDLGNSERMKMLREAVSASVQRVLDETMGIADPNILRTITHGQEAGLPRKRIRAGVVVTGVLIRKLKPETEVLEAMQEEAGAPYRVRAEKIAQDGLGRDYSIFRRATAAEQAAREGATVVVGMGGDMQTALMGGLGRKGGTTEDILSQVSERLGMGGLRGSRRKGR